MRAIFMGKNKPSVAEALEYLVQKQVEVVSVVAPPRGEAPLSGPRLAEVADAHGIPTRSDTELYRCIEAGSQGGSPAFELGDVDLVLSFLFWKKIQKPLIDLPKIGCLNFHPAPLPDYRGWGAYHFGIYERQTRWGVAAHYVDAEFDTGDLVKVLRFDIDPKRDTAYSLEQASQVQLVALFKEVVDLACAGGPLPRTKQGPGRSFSRPEAEALRKISPDDTPDQIDRKVRAFWYPPYGGATIELQGSTYYVVDEPLVAEIGKRYHR